MAIKRLALVLPVSRNGKLGTAPFCTHRLRCSTIFFHEQWNSFAGNVSLLDTPAVSSGRMMSPRVNGVIRFSPKSL